MTPGDDANRLAAEARARVLIDRQLTDAGWSMQDSRSLTLFAAQDVAGRRSHRHLHLQVNARVVAAGSWRGLHSVGVRDMIEAINGIGHAAVVTDPEFRAGGQVVVHASEAERMTALASVGADGALVLAEAASCTPKGLATDGSLRPGEAQMGALGGSPIEPITVNFLRTLCGLGEVTPPLTCANAPIHTLKRNSTTSPSAIT